MAAVLDRILTRLTGRRPRPAMEVLGTATEREVARIWAGLLRRDRLGLHDNFFDEGGDSLLAVQAVLACRDAWGVDVSLQCLFEAPTVAAFAALLDRRAAPGEAAAPRLEWD